MYAPYNPLVIPSSLVNTLRRTLSGANAMLNLLKRLLLMLLLQLSCALCPLKDRTVSAEICLAAVEEVFSSDPASVTHASKDATLIVQIDRCIELGNISCIHD